MNKSIISVSLFLVNLFLLVGMTLHANDSPLNSNLTYYIASDDNGVQQVFQLLLDAEQEARQLTHTKGDVITFGVAYDALGIVYISDGQLWLQSIHTAEAESLATVSATQFNSSPIFSQDGNFVAYADNGVWLYDLANRQTRQILADVPLEEMASNANVFRIYEPETFVVDADGAVTHLIVNVGVWEWKTAGVYDLATGELLELDGKLHTSVLALSDGRALVYGNNGVDGEGSLYLADSLDSINSATPTVYFHELTEAVLFAEQAVEIETGLVRVFGIALIFTPNQPITSYFYFDYDVNMGTVSEVQVVELPTQEENGFTIAGELSSSGHVIPVYWNAQYTDAGSIFGNFRLMNLLTGEDLDGKFPEVVGVFHLQP